MKTVFLISLIAAAVSAGFSAYRQLQMLQQNSYFPSRYGKWVVSSYTVPLAGESILFCLSSLLYAQKLFVWQAAVVLLLLAVRIPRAVSAHRKSIKKLVFTARIKRLYGAVAVVFAVLIAIYALFPETLGGEIATMILFALGFVSPLLTLLAWALTFPVEKAFSSYYIRDAKRILRGQKRLTVIGITGSYGKTSTKFILTRILSEKFNVVCTPHSFNTPMGIVRTVRNDLKPQTQVFVCEMGAKNVGDIREICEIAHPTYGIITSVGAQHLETFKTIDNVFKTKFELADEVRKNGGTVFVNGASAEIAARLTGDEGYCVYGTEESGAYAENVTCGKNGSSFTVVLGNTRFEVSTKLLGAHAVSNIVAAAALAFRLGVTPEQIRFAVAALKPTEHRLELKRGQNGSLLIDDAYNANPEGSLEAVRVLGSFTGMRKVIITPGMIELGSKEYDCNYALGAAAAEVCDDIILVGKNRSKPLQDAVSDRGFAPDRVHVAASFAEAMQIYLPTADPNSVVLIENDLPDNYLN